MKHTCSFLLLVLAGCTSPSPVLHIVHESVPPPAKPWSEGGQVTTYWLGRTTTGLNDNVIHEAHPFYRLEGAGQPQLATPPGVYYPPTAPPSPTNAAFEQYEALRAEMARTRDLIFKLTHASEGLVQQAGALRSTTEANRREREQFGQLLQSTAALSNRLQMLEQRIAPPPPPAHSPK